MIIDWFGSFSGHFKSGRTRLQGAYATLQPNYKGLLWLHPQRPAWSF